MRGTFLAVACASLMHAAAQTCGATLYGSTFDLSGLILNSVQKSYNVSDIRDPATHYFFNVCKDVPVPQTQPAGRCAASSIMAWQVENDGTEKEDNCYALSGPASSGWSFSIYGKLNVAGQHFAKDVFIAVAAS
jgi:hypothetical protein